MKKIIFATALTAISLSSFAQIDDVINKPKEKKPKDSNSNPSMFLSVFKIFNQLEVTNLVDQMEADGVSERNFVGVVGIDGQIARVNISDVGDRVGKALPFTVKLSTDNKVFVSVAAVSVGNLFEATSDKVSDDDYDFNSSSPHSVSKADFLVFQIDNGLNFRNVKSVGWRLVDLELNLRIAGDSSKRFFAFILGGNIGGQKETITMPDGQEIQVGLAKESTWQGPDDSSGMAFAYALKSGLIIRDQVGNGTLTFKGVVDYSRLEGGKWEGGQRTENMDRTQLFVRPNLTYTLPLSAKKSLSFGVGANFSLIDNYKGGTGTSIDLRDSNRQPYNASLKFNF